MGVRRGQDRGAQRVSLPDVRAVTIEEGGTQESRRHDLRREVLSAQAAVATWGGPDVLFSLTSRSSPTTSLSGASPTCWARLLSISFPTRTMGTISNLQYDDVSDFVPDTQTAQE